MKAILNSIIEIIKTKIFKQIFLDWIIVLCIIFFVLTIKGLCIYLINPAEYTITNYSLKDYFHYMSTIIEPKVNFFAAITAILSAVISLAIPLSINQVANSLKDYNDNEVSEMFFKEPVYLQIQSVLFFLAFSLLFWYFSKNEFLVGSLCISFVILTLYYLYKFFNRVIRYITATDDVVHEYFHTNVLNLFDFD